MSLAKRLAKLERRLDAAEPEPDDELGWIERQAAWWRSHGNLDAARGCEATARALRQFRLQHPEYEELPPGWRQMLAGEHDGVDDDGQEQATRPGP